MERFLRQAVGLDGPEHKILNLDDNDNMTTVHEMLRETQKRLESFIDRAERRQKAHQEQLHSVKDALRKENLLLTRRLDKTERLLAGALPDLFSAPVWLLWHT